MVVCVVCCAAGVDVSGGVFVSVCACVCVYVCMYALAYVCLLLLNTVKVPSVSCFW